MDHQNPIPSKKAKIQEDEYDINQFKEKYKTLIELFGELSEKPIKQHQEKESKKCKIDQLPVEQLDDIFKYLLPDHLVPLRLTCKSFKQSVDTYFRLNNRGGIVQLKLCKDGEIKHIFRHEYENHFGSLIKEIFLTIHIIEPSSFKKLLNIVQTKCNKEIQRLALHFVHNENLHQIQLNDDLEMIAEKIKDLKMLYLLRPPLIGRFLKKRENLEILFVVKSLKKHLHDHEDEWINTVHPNLKALIFVDLISHDDLDDSDDETISTPTPLDLNKFLSNTPRLQAIGLNNPAAIQSFLGSGIHVSYAALWFDLTSELVNSLPQIQSICKEDRILSLHLGITNASNKNDLSRIFNAICNIPNVKSFHFEKSIFCHKANVPIQPYLETLCIRNPHPMHDLNQITDLFPKLQNFHLSLPDRNGQNLKQLIMSIANRNKTIKHATFAVHDNSISISNDDVIEINAARAKLNKPPILIIDTDAVVCQANLEFIFIQKLFRAGCLTCKSVGLLSCQQYEDASAYVKTLPI